MNTHNFTLILAGISELTPELGDSLFAATGGDIELNMRNGVAFKEAIVGSATTRAQPIMLTGLAAMLGAFFILDDPIFNGLAIALIFGILVSTLLTLVVIPVLYYMAYRNRPGALAQGSQS